MKISKNNNENLEKKEYDENSEEKFSCNFSNILSGESVDKAHNDIKNSFIEKYNNEKEIIYISQDVDLDINFTDIMQDLKNILIQSIFEINYYKINEQIFFKYDIKYQENIMTDKKFIKPLEKGYNQKFENNENNKLFKNYISLINFLEKIKEKIDNEFLNCPLKIDLNIQIVLKESEEKNNNDIKNINCKYYFPKNNNIKDYGDNNIFNNNIEGFQSFINAIKNYISFSSISSISKKSDNSNFCISPLNIDLENKKNKKNYYEIIKIEEIQKIKCDHYNNSDCANYIKEISNGFLVINGENDTFHFYDKNCKKIGEIYLTKYKDYNEYKISYLQKSNQEIYGIFETNESIISQNNIKNLMICTKEGLKFFSIKYHNNKINNLLQREITHESCSVFFETKDNTYIIGGLNGVYHLDKQGKKIKHIEGEFKGGIKINDNLFGFTSNSLIRNEQKLIFYNIESKDICEQIENFSFINSINGLTLSREDDSRKKILLCACKKYGNNDKNGILIVELNLQFKKFYDTKDFEVYCFCPIKKFINENDFPNDTYNIIYTDYFFVGGLDSEKKRGLIKLYKIIFDDSNTEIEWMQDIIFENNNMNFQKSITCIIQSNFTGKIFITSSDGNIYMCSAPNINSYLNDDSDMQEDENMKVLNEQS